MIVERFKAIIGIVLLILLGFLAGIAVTLRWNQKPPPPPSGGPGPDFIISFLDKEIQPVLELNVDQQVQFREIVMNAHQQLVTAFNEFQPRAHEILDQTHEKLRDILNEEQKEKFDQLLTEREGSQPQHPPDRDGNRQLTPPDRDGTQQPPPPSRGGNRPPPPDSGGNQPPNSPE